MTATHPEDPSTTREKILHSACELFANKGFKETTVQDICAKADANIASVNYYFGNKENLYHKAWEYAYAVTMELGGPINEEQPPLDCITQILSQRIRALFNDGPAGWLPRLIFQEHANKSHMSKQLKSKTLLPIRDLMLRHLKAYLGPSADQKTVEVALSICHGTLPGLMINMRMVHFEQPDIPKPDDALVDSIVAHTCTFLRAGLSALKQQIEGTSS